MRAALTEGVVVGYHGCSRVVAKRLVSSRSLFRSSQNGNDWLGTGIYFWQADPERAEEWARRRHGPNAATVGAVIGMGLCLDLTTEIGIERLRLAYDQLHQIGKKAGLSLPKNHRNNKNLDCAVVDHCCAMIEAGEGRKVTTVRALFEGGNRLFRASSFRDWTHVQIAVRDTTAILGVFKPI